MLDHLSTNVLSSQLRAAISEGMNDYFQNEAKVINETTYSQQKVSKEQVQEAVDGLNQFLQPTHTSIRFEYHEQLNEYYVKVVDDKTDETIREIPSKKLLDFYAAMTEFVGLMVDKKI
ncbi:flagellar protein FlaG [Peribacillus sp. Hz7]|uniref:flagellar protein FlaG n=1 Tax=Peribacillus sp. Hz7 TaxID=3344873 RepID=UPI0035CC2D5E